MLDTIVALATPPMMGALAIIRLSGPEAFNIVTKSFTKDLTKLNKNAMVYGKLFDDEELVDEVIAFCFKGPHSFTGEDVVEISCHGSMLIANEIIELMIKNGARLAGRGEFTNRAYLNGKLDLVQAEAVNDMITATTKEAKKLSLLSLVGETSKVVYPIRERIAAFISPVIDHFTQHIHPQLQIVIRMIMVTTQVPFIGLNMSQLPGESLMFKAVVPS